MEYAQASDPVAATRSLAWAYFMWGVTITGKSKSRRPNRIVGSMPRILGDDWPWWVHGHLIKPIGGERWKYSVVYCSNESLPKLIYIIPICIPFNAKRSSRKVWKSSVSLLALLVHSKWKMKQEDSTPLSCSTMRKWVGDSLGWEYCTTSPFQNFTVRSGKKS